MIRFRKSLNFVTYHKTVILDIMQNFWHISLWLETRQKCSQSLLLCWKERITIVILCGWYDHPQRKVKKSIINIRINTIVYQGHFTMTSLQKLIIFIFTNNTKLENKIIHKIFAFMVKTVIFLKNWLKKEVKNLPGEKSFMY